MNAASRGSGHTAASRDGAVCALTEEFPLVPSRRMLNATTRCATRTRSGREAFQDGTSVTLLSLIMVKIREQRRDVLTSGVCRLLQTALPLGWTVLLGVGVWRGGARKFLWTRRLLRYVEPHCRLVVFTDATDAFIQRTPTSVIATFARQHCDFLWSVESNCFPFGAWPYNLGLGRYVCDGLFPPVGKLTHSRFINSGGWVGTVRAAELMLDELVRRSKGGICGEDGSDQWYAGTQYLRAAGRDLSDSTVAGRVGLDDDGIVFGVAPFAPKLRKRPENRRSPLCGVPTAALCFPHGSCPAVLHFPGHWKKFTLAKAFQRLHPTRTSSERTTADCHGAVGGTAISGRVSAVNIHTGEWARPTADEALNCTAGRAWVDELVAGRGRFAVSLLESVASVGLL